MLYMLLIGVSLTLSEVANACSLFGEAADRANTIAFATGNYFLGTIAVVAVLPYFTVLSAPIFIFHPLVQGPPMCGYTTTFPSQASLAAAVALLVYRVVTTRPTRV
jgi:hypothetical protein